MKEYKPDQPVRAKDRDRAHTNNSRRTDWSDEQKRSIYGWRMNGIVFTPFFRDLFRIFFYIHRTRTLTKVLFIYFFFYHANFLQSREFVKMKLTKKVSIAPLICNLTRFCELFFYYPLNNGPLRFTKLHFPYKFTHIRSSLNIVYIIHCVYMEF